MAKVTMNEVAAAAGVSMKSVSRVINREPNVSEKLRARVQAAIDALDYVPDLAARSLAGTRSYAIGILFDNPSPHYTMKVQAGAYEACREHGYHLLVESMDSERDDVLDQINSVLRNARVDGFVLTPPLTENEIVMDVLDARKIPYVRIAPVSFPGRSASVAIDDAAAAAEIAQHFWSLGHRRFGFVKGPAGHGAAQTRRAGFIGRLKELGCEDIVESYGGFRFDLGIDAGRELMTLPNPPTAIFAANDDSAAGVLSRVAQLGLKVPGDVSVAGFDDSWIAKSVWPYLTTIYQPIYEMAHTAATWLIDGRAQDGTAPVAMIDYELVVRESTAALVDA